MWVYGGFTEEGKQERSRGKEGIAGYREGREAGVAGVDRGSKRERNTRIGRHGDTGGDGIIDLAVWSKRAEEQSRYEFREKEMKTVRRKKS